MWLNVFPNLFPVIVWGEFWIIKKRNKRLECRIFIIEMKHNHFFENLLFVCADTTCFSFREFHAQIIFDGNVALVDFGWRKFCTEIEDDFVNFFFTLFIIPANFTLLPSFADVSIKKSNRFWKKRIDLTKNELILKKYTKNCRTSVIVYLDCIYKCPRSITDSAPLS